MTILIFNIGKVVKKLLCRICFILILVDFACAQVAAHMNIASNPKFTIEEKYTQSSYSNPKTIEYIRKHKNELNGTEVNFYAKVVKINSNKNNNLKWLRLANDELPACRIIAYTFEDDMPAEGDIVSINGILRTNVEMGQGYFFPILIEKAVFYNNQ